MSSSTEGGSDWMARERDLQIARSGFEHWWAKRELTQLDVQMGYQFSRRIMELERELSSERYRKQLALQEHSQRMKDLETYLLAGGNAATIARLELTAVRYFRIEAETWVVFDEMKGK